MMLDAQDILAKAGLQRGERVVDIGSGDGYFSVTAAAMVGESGRVHGVDIHEPSIKAFREEIARGKLTNVEAVPADATARIPLEDGTVDFCLMVNVLHGFTENNEARPAMKEAARVTRKGGKLLVVEFKKVASAHGPPLAVRLAPEQVMEVASPCGFAPGTTFEAGADHYAVLMTKG